MTRPPEELAARLGLSFSDPDLLQRALTHSSAPGSQGSNQRLEFLGDAVLGMVVAEHVWRSRPDLPEGDLTRLRAHLVRGERLSEIGHELELGSYLMLGEGERKSGGRRRDSTLEDAVEALIGAVYLDGGYAAARALVQQLYGERLAQLPAPEELKDPKTRLQELLQGRGMGRPRYRELGVSGADHALCFRMLCEVPELELSAEGEGGSRRKAEQAAAAAVLALIPEGRGA